MRNIVNNIATAATLGVALLPWIALSVAHAETATIRISDLNMSQPAQVAVFDRRVDAAARKLCDGITPMADLASTTVCKRAVREEAMDKLSQAQRQTLSVASR